MSDSKTGSRREEARGSGGRSDVRRLAARTLERVLASRAPAQGPLEEAATGLEPRDRRLLRELVLGSLRWRGRLDHVLECASGRAVGKVRRRLRAPLRIGLYQLLYLDRVPAFAAVDQAVSEARRRAGARAAGFVNAVLRRVAGRPDLDSWPVESEEITARLAIETSHPEFLVRRWLERFGEAATRRLLAASNRPKPMSLLALEDRVRLAGELRRAGVETVSGSFSPSSLRVTAGEPLLTAAFGRGAFYVQDEASQAAALVPPPRPGEVVLDAAAAPGGKGFALAAVDRSVWIAAGDVSLARLRRLRANHERLGSAERLLALDAAQPPFGAVFDRVIADLPCSGSGTLARHPELKWRLSPSEIDRLAAAGLEILEGLAPAVRPGGLLIAITCSLEREENEDVVARLLERRPELEPVDLQQILDPESARHVETAGRWRLLTGAEHDGFTVHVLRRSSGDSGRSPESAPR